MYHEKHIPCPSSLTTTGMMVVKEETNACEQDSCTTQNRHLSQIIFKNIQIRAIHECTRELTLTRTCEYFNSKSGTRTRANLFPRVTCTRESSNHEVQVHPPSLYQKWQ